MGALEVTFIEAKKKALPINSENSISIRDVW